MSVLQLADRFPSLNREKIYVVDVLWVHNAVTAEEAQPYKRVQTVVAPNDNFHPV